MSENMEKFRHMDGAEAVVDKEHITISFQHGNPADVGVNGCRIEDVIDALYDKIAEFQERELACEENATTLYHLDIARQALNLRRARREQQGVFGQRVRHKAETPS